MPKSTTLPVANINEVKEEPLRKKMSTIGQQLDESQDTSSEEDDEEEAKQLIIQKTIEPPSQKQTI